MIEYHRAEISLRAVLYARVMHCYQTLKMGRGVQNSHHYLITLNCYVLVINTCTASARLVRPVHAGSSDRLHRGKFSVAGNAARLSIIELWEIFFSQPWRIPVRRADSAILHSMSVAGRRRASSGVVGRRLCVCVLSDEHDDVLFVLRPCEARGVHLCPRIILFHSIVLFKCNEWWPPPSLQPSQSNLIKVSVRLNIQSSAISVRMSSIQQHELQFASAHFQSNLCIVLSDLIGSNQQNCHWIEKHLGGFTGHWQFIHQTHSLDYEFVRDKHFCRDGQVSSFLVPFNVLFLFFFGRWGWTCRSVFDWEQSFFSFFSFGCLLGWSESEKEAKGEGEEEEMEQGAGRNEGGKMFQ